MAAQGGILPADVRLADSTASTPRILLWGLPALAATAVLIVLSHWHFVFRGLAGMVACVASIVYPPAAPALLLVMQFAPSLILMGASTVPTSEFLFTGLMLVNLLVSDSIRGKKEGQAELYVSRSTIVNCLLFFFLVVASKGWESEEWPLSPYTIAAYSMGLLTAMQLKRRSDQAFLLWAFIVVAGVLGAWAMIQAEGLALKNPERGPGFVDPNIYAYFIGAGLIAALSLVVEGAPTRRLWLKVGLCLLIAVSGVGVLRTASRGIAAAIAISACVMLAIRYRKPWQFAMVAALLVWVAPMAYELPVFDQLRSRFSEKTIESLSGRLDIWQDAIAVLGKSSFDDWLLGHGSGGALTVLGGRGSHNMFLELILQYGLVGLGLAGLIAAKALWQAVRTKGYWGYTQIGLWAFFVAAGMSIGHHQYYFTWILVGMMLPQPCKRAPTASSAVG
jgi:O-antigen ligase